MSFPIEKETRIRRWISSVHLGHRSTPQEPLEGLSESLEKKSPSVPQRQEALPTTDLQDYLETMVQGETLQEEGSTLPPPHLHDSPHGCIQSRLGGLCGRKTLSGELVSSVSALPHQLLGTDGCLPHSEEAQTQERFPHTPSPGQPDGCSLPEERRVEISGSQPHRFSNNETPTAEVSALFDFSSSGSEERSGGFSFEGFSPRGGMDTEQGVLPGGGRSRSRSPDRSILDGFKSPTPPLRIPGSGPAGSGLGCTESGLEQVALNIPVSTSEYPYGGPGSFEDFPGHSSPDSPSMAGEPVVPRPDGPQPGISTSAPPQTVARGSREDLLRFLLSDPQPSYMDFLTRTYGRDFTPENIPSLTEHIRHSSRRQYQSNWASWVSFCRETQPKSITKDFMISYLRHLFEVKKLSVATIKSQKSSLSDPIRLAFGIDLLDKEFSLALRSFALRKPASPQRTISWSLEKVLSLLESIDPLSCDFSDLLSKTISWWLLLQGIG